MKKYYKIVFFMVMICTQAFAAQPVRLTEKNSAQFNKIQQQLSAFATLSGDFVQTRTIKLLTQPLISHGHFTLSKNNGLQWLQTAPFKSLLIVSKTRIDQQLGDEPATILTQKQQPVVFAFTNIFLSVFNGDIEQVQHYFSINFSGDVNSWNIVLTPSSFPLTKAIKNITLTGGKTIRTITVDDLKGNRMKISLFNIKGS